MKTKTLILAMAVSFGLIGCRSSEDQMTENRDQRLSQEQIQTIENLGIDDAELMAYLQEQKELASENGESSAAEDGNEGNEQEVCQSADQIDAIMQRINENPNIKDDVKAMIGEKLAQVCEKQLNGGKPDEVGGGKPDGVGGGKPDGVGGGKPDGVGGGKPDGVGEDDSEEEQ
jgi:hypothetical protein